MKPIAIIFLSLIMLVAPSAQSQEARKRTPDASQNKTQPLQLPRAEGKSWTKRMSCGAEELRRQYSIGYYPKVASRPGEERRIKVKVNRARVEVRARSSYIYWP